MTKQRKITIGKVATILAVLPLLLYAVSSGPDVGKSGVPGESVCTECHSGTVNSGSGSVAVTFPGSMTYVPGVKQHLTVTITDSAQRMAGFQLTARLASNTASMAGSFTSTDRFTAVACGASPTDQIATFLDFGSNQNCPAAKPFTYIEHTLEGASRSQSGSLTFEFDWTPPATNVGDIRIYVAGNAANGNGQNTGDRIYTANYTLTPAASGGPAPTISGNGVVNGASFAPGIVPNSWFTIQGTNLSTSTRTWDGAIVEGRLPTELDGVKVSVGGKDAYVYFISATQINAVAPDVGTGSMSVTVSNSGGASSAAAANSATVDPAFFLWPGNYAVATRQDFTWAVKNGTFPGNTTTPAKPGEVIILWGTGFGPTNPAAPFGMQIPSTGTLYSTANPVTVTVGGTNATVFGAVMAPGFAGLFQVAIQIPENAADGDLPVVATISGAQSSASTVITVQR